MKNTHHLQLQKQKNMRRILAIINSSPNVLDEKALIRECFDKLNFPPRSTTKYLDELHEVGLINREKGEVWTIHEVEKPKLTEEEEKILEDPKEIG